MPPPRRKRSGGKILAGSVGELARLGAKKIALDGMPVWLIKRNKDFVAISAICTHAGCVVRYDTIKGLMICPCHGGIFDISGNVLSGPPRDPLRRFRLQFENNLIYILW
jgi:Rieske Fe-S protein